MNTPGWHVPLANVRQQRGSTLAAFMIYQRENWLDYLVLVRREDVWCL